MSKAFRFVILKTWNHQIWQRKFPQRNARSFPKLPSFLTNLLGRSICCVCQNLYARDLASGSRLGRYTSNWAVPKVEQLSPELLDPRPGHNSEMGFLPPRVPRRASRILWRLAKSIRICDHGQDSCGASQNGVTS